MMETAKDGAPTLENRTRIASDLIRVIGVSVLAGVVTACLVAGVVMLLSAPGA